MSPTDRRPTEAILGAHIALSAAIEQHAVNPCGLDSTTADLLLRVWFSPNSRCRAADISEQLMLSPSHISRRLDRAATSGLLCREPDPDDRRAHQVCLTKQGRAAVENFYPRLENVLRFSISEVLTNAEQDTLVSLLSRVETAARAVAS